MTTEPLRTHDMYGNEIYRLGETGYGVSMCFWWPGDGKEHPKRPEFTLFHMSDGFRQSLFTFRIEDPEWHHQGHSASTLNVFHERIAELMATKPHG